VLLGIFSESQLVLKALILFAFGKDQKNLDINQGFFVLNYYS
jgi:hypothetical protein